jgi:NAD+ kinase
LNRHRVLIVAKRSMVDQLVRDRPDPRAVALLRSGDVSVARWRSAHLEHRRTLRRVQSTLRELGAKFTLQDHPGCVFDADGLTLVITVGGDGTLLAASHHVGSTAILGVNSAKSHSVGFFCAANQDNLETVIAAALSEDAPRVTLARMQVSLNERICSRRVLNEALFCHAIPAATSRYIVDFDGRQEEQRSSGVWVGTAAGSTAATRSAGGKILPFVSRKVQLVVREPYLIERRKLELDRLIVPPSSRITLLSKMEDARLYLDGPFRQIPVRLGDRVSFHVSDEPLTVLGLDRGRSGRMRAVDPLEPGASDAPAAPLA